jgi:hypothetical protein
MVIKKAASWPPLLFAKAMMQARQSPFKIIGLLIKRAAKHVLA